MTEDEKRALAADIERILQGTTDKMFEATERALAELFEVARVAMRQYFADLDRALRKPESLPPPPPHDRRVN